MNETHVALGALPRTIAAEVLFAVRENGAFIAAELDQQLLLNPDMETRDVALATELAYGAVRNGRALEQRILEHAPRGTKDARVMCHMLVAAYQLCLLDRVPPFAAVDVAVTAARKLGGTRVAGFVNAVLRKVARGPRLDRDVALRCSIPDWLFSEVESVLDTEQARSLFGIDDAGRSPDVCVRFKRDAQLPEWAQVGEAGRWLKQVRRFRRAGDLRRHPEYREGRFVVQEEGAALCALALGALPGETVLDACAGRGQKAAVIAEQLGSAGQLWVSDIRRAKLQALVEEFHRLGLKEPTLHTVADGDEALPTDFDRILVDAPCTGSGTFRHRPEIALRLEPDDMQRLAARSLEIIERVTPHLRPGGSLLFVVCSILPGECERVVERISGLVPAPFPETEFSALLPSRDVHEFRLLPGKHGTDGFYLAHFRKAQT